VKKSDTQSGAIIRMTGNGCPWRDEFGSLVGAQKKGARITNDLDEGTVKFTDACQIADDWVLINTQLNHDFDMTTAISPHLHWFQASANVPNWLIEYRWQKQGSAKTTAWTKVKYSGHKATYTAGTINQITEFTDISVPVGVAMSDIVQVRLQRDTDNDSGEFGGADPLVGDAIAVFFDIHIKINSHGSQQEYVK
jgi:hypothetical protein